MQYKNQHFEATFTEDYYDVFDVKIHNKAQQLHLSFGEDITTQNITDAVQRMDNLYGLNDKAYAHIVAAKNDSLVTYFFEDHAAELGDHFANKYEVDQTKLTADFLLEKLWLKTIAVHNSDCYGSEDLDIDYIFVLDFVLDPEVSDELLVVVMQPDTTLIQITTES